MDKIPFTQSFLGAVLVAVVGGLIVHIATERQRLPLIEGALSTEAKHLTSSAPVSSAAVSKDSEKVRGVLGREDNQETGGTAPAASLATSADISGKWTGEWSIPDGTLFTFTMDLQLSEVTVVAGEIDWTYKLSPRIEDQRLIGLSAVELVRGSFNPGTNVLMLQGYDKRDQYGVIALDSYQLNLSDDAQELRGKTSSHGTWQGVFIGRRARK